MKNVQVIDGAVNCSYPIYAFTDEEFTKVFPEPGQDIKFIEDAAERLGEDALDEVFKDVWQRRVEKPDVHGIHGILFYELQEKNSFIQPSLSETSTTRLVPIYEAPALLGEC